MSQTATVCPLIEVLRLCARVAGEVISNPAFDPELTPTVHRSTCERAVPEATTQTHKPAHFDGYLPSHVLLEEAANLPENLLRFGRAIVAQIMCMRLSLVDLQYGLNAGLTQLAMHAHRIAE